jgi:hypothetical protein
MSFYFSYELYKFYNNGLYFITSLSAEYTWRNMLAVCVL